MGRQSLFANYIGKRRTRRQGAAASIKASSNTRELQQDKRDS